MEDLDIKGLEEMTKKLFNKESCFICGKKYDFSTINNLNNKQFENFILEKRYKLIKLYKYFPDIKSSKGINYSRESLINNTVHLSETSHFDDPFDSNIVMSFNKFCDYRLSYYSNIFKIKKENINKDELIKNIITNLDNTSYDTDNFDILYKDIKNDIDIWKNIRLNVKDEREALFKLFIYDYECLMRVLSGMFYISCFTNSPYNKLMWSMYANKHKGFCVEYTINISEIDKYKAFHYLYPLIYSSTKKEVSCEVIKMFEKQHDIDDVYKAMINGILTKSYEWIFEEEWRLVDFSEKCLSKSAETIYDDNKNVEFFPITKVYLGNQMEIEDKYAIYNICKSKNVECVSMKKNVENYSLIEEQRFEYF